MYCKYQIFAVKLQTTGRVSLLRYLQIVLSQLQTKKKCINPKIHFGLTLSNLLTA